MRVTSWGFVFSILVAGCGAEAGGEETAPDPVNDIASAASTCASYSATLSAHVQAGRAVAHVTTFFVFQFTTYYPTSSTEVIGTDPSQVVTLYDRVGGGYTANAQNCAAAECGNGKVDVKEECDGPIAGGDACESWGPYVSGKVVCKPDCKLDMSACRSPLCGNGILEVGELCDGASFLAGNDCASLNPPKYAGGKMSCSPSCTPDDSTCTLRCGNGVIEEGEQCDGTARAPAYARATCSDFPYLYNAFPFSTAVPYAPGPVTCNATCQIDVGGCKPQPGCYYETKPPREVNIVCH
jgi:hypothetical protein